MTVSLKADGVEVSNTSSASSVTVSPAYPAGTVGKDINILTISTTVLISTINTPPGWHRVIEGRSIDDQTGVELLVAIFSRKGALTGTQAVTVTRALSSGTVTAAIDTYERATGKTWFISGYESTYEYTDEEDVLHTGTNVFVSLNELDPVITIVFNESTSRPGFDITITAVDDYSTIVVTAVDPSAEFGDLIVRGANNAQLTGDIFTCSDYEFANFDRIIYQFDFYTDGVLQDTLSSSEITNVPRDFFVAGGYYPRLNSWLRSVNIPELSIPCFISEMPEREREGRVLNKSNVLGRKFPVITTDKFGARTGTMKFSVGAYDDLTWALDNDTVDDVELLLDQGDVLLLSHIDAAVTKEDPTFLVVENVKRTRMGVYNQVVFMYEIQYIEVERPATTARVTDRDWQDVSDNNINWALVRSTHENWLQVLLRP
jgi:hypothetical protein